MLVLPSRKQLSEQKWYVPKERAFDTPSVKLGLDSNSETFYRQSCAALIQDLGQRTRMHQTSISAGIIFMHRFYTYRDFKSYPRNDMAVACLMLASKAEEQLRGSTIIFRAYFSLLWGDKKAVAFVDKSIPQFVEYSNELHKLEQILLLTLNAEVSVELPNTYVVAAAKEFHCSGLVRRAAHYFATNSLHITRFCVTYPPWKVAFVCLLMASECGGSPVKSKNSSEAWYQQYDPDTTLDDLKAIADEYITAMEACPAKIKRVLELSQLRNKVEGSTTLQDTTYLEDEDVQTDVKENLKTVAESVEDGECSSEGDLLSDGGSKKTSRRRSISEKTHKEEESCPLERIEDEGPLGGGETQFGLRLQKAWPGIAQVMAQSPDKKPIFGNCEYNTGVDENTEIDADPAVQKAAKNSTSKEEKRSKMNSERKRKKTSEKVDRLPKLRDFTDITDDQDFI